MAKMLRGVTLSGFSHNIDIHKLHNYHFSDDLIEKELEIKLDITKKSRRINRPVQFADQYGEVFCLAVLADILTICRPYYGGGEI